MKKEIEHFYWVASAYNEPGKPAYHVQVFDVAETMEEVAELGGQAKRGRTLSATQAEQEGFDVKAIKEWISAEALAGFDAMRRTAIDLTASLQTANAEIDRLKAALPEAPA